MSVLADFVDQNQELSSDRILRCIVFVANGDLNRLEKAIDLLEGMSMGKIDLGGKYYTSASKKLLELLNAAGANAAQKGMDSTKLFVAAAKPNKGRGFMRPRSRAKLRGRYAKSTNIEIILEER